MQSTADWKEILNGVPECPVIIQLICRASDTCLKVGVPIHSYFFMFSVAAGGGGVGVGEGSLPQLNSVQ